MNEARNVPYRKKFISHLNCAEYKIKRLGLDAWGSSVLNTEKGVTLCSENWIVCVGYLKDMVWIPS